MAALSQTEPNSVGDVLAEAEEIDQSEGVTSYFPTIFRDLLANPGMSPADAAQRIRHDYLHGFLPSVHCSNIRVMTWPWANSCI
jgi:hypothetical protein